MRQEFSAVRNEYFKTFMLVLTPYPYTNYSFWKATCKFTRAPITSLSPIRTTNRWVRDDAGKVELYADHLQKVFTSHDMPMLTLPEFEHHPPKLFSFLTRLVAHVLDRINVKKAPGADCITGRMLKELPRTGILWPTRIFNAALHLGAYSTTWKNAKVIM